MTREADVAIVGGGVVGQLLALALSDRGRTVLLLDAGPACPPASWAGGGILSALFPWRYPDPLTALTLDACTRYQVLARRILAVEGPDPEILTCGMHVEAGDEMAAALSWAERYAISAEPASDSPLGAEGVVSFPTIAAIRNPRLLKGLATLLAAEHVAVQRPVTVVGMDAVAGRWRLETSAGVVVAQQVALSAGAWSAGLLASRGLQMPLMPVKGEMLLYGPQVPAPPHILLAREGYVIPRADGHMLVGSTVQPGLMDHRLTDEAGRFLENVAARLWPPLVGQIPLAQWAGIRPGSSRSWPIMGELPGGPGLFVATGHYRNGLVSAPASAELLADLMCGRTPSLDPEPYSVSSSSPP
ncbi:MAG: oxidoreductase [Alcanivorax sp.]|nr:oxidoreductase [Alcanivorax sp.]